ncbi:MAG: hypothetical protein K2Y32_13580 [Candidatus Obscuribacterales bacterium]|nr:hypothetical protein [Candidatus Obscuribacterales bacterium]
MSELSGEGEKLKEIESGRAQGRPERRFTASGINEALSMAIGHVRLGDLLKASGIVSYEYLKEALSSFEEKGLPLGKMLTMSGFLSEAELQVALEIQTLINNRQLPFDVGVRVLNLSYQDKISLAEAFSRASVVQPEDVLTNKLGQLLTQSRIINPEDLEEALAVSQRTGLPLGHIFCYRSLLSQELLDTALLGQQLVRRGSLSREQCISALSAAREREIAYLKKEVNANYRPVLRRGTPRLGELFFSVGMLDDMSLIAALQMALTRSVSCGVAIRETAGLSEELIDRAVDLQEMIDNETISLDQAREVLGLIAEEGFEKSLAQSSCAMQSGNPSRMMVQLLKDNRFWPPSQSRTEGLDPQVLLDISERLEVNYNQGYYLAKIIDDNDLAPHRLSYKALRLSHLLHIKAVPYERAVAALELAQARDIFVDEALVQLNVLYRTRLK